MSARGGNKLISSDNLLVSKKMMVGDNLGGSKKIMGSEKLMVGDNLMGSDNLGGSNKLMGGNYGNPQPSHTDSEHLEVPQEKDMWKS